MEAANRYAHQDLRNALSVRNPERAMKKAMGFGVSKLPEKLTLFEYRQVGSDVFMTIDRAMYPTVFAVLDRRGVDYAVQDRMITNKVDFPDCSAVLEEYQETAVKSMLDGSCQGIAEIATAGGKTIIALALAARLKQKTIVLVHTNDLITQWKKRCEQFLPGADVAVWDNQRQKVGKHITIATVQSLYKFFEMGNKASLVTQFGLLLQDELHHVSSPTFHSVSIKFPAKYRYGFTATARRKDGKTFYLHSVFGDTLVKYGYAEVADRIILPTVYPVYTQLEDKYHDIYAKRGYGINADYYLDYVKLDELLSTDTLRNKQIIDLVVSSYTDDTYCLILVKRVEHAKNLAGTLNSVGISTEAIYAEGLAKKKREDILSRMRNKEFHVLIGTTLADEGLDLVSLNVLILAAPTSFAGKLTQRIGRVIRIAEGKTEVKVFDLIDADIPELLNSWYSRLRFYNANGMTIEGDLDELEEGN